MNILRALLSTSLALFMHMLHLLFRTTLWILLINLLIKGTWVLGIEALMQNALGLQDYGLYYTLLNLSFILSFFLDFGLARHNSTHTALQNVANQGSTQSILRWKFSLSALYLLGTMALGFLLGYTSEQLVFLLLASSGQIIASYILYFRSFFSGLKYFLWEGIGSVLDRLIMIVICLLLLLGPLRPYLSVSSYLLAQLAGYLISFLLLWFIWSRLNRKNSIEHVSLDFRKFALIVLPFAALVGLESLNDKVSIVLLERLQDNGAIEAGKYAFGLRWLDAYKMFVSIIGIILLPFYAQSLNEPERIKSILHPTLKLAFVATVLGVSIVSVFSEELVIMLTGQENSELETIFTISAIAFLPYPFIFVLQPLLTVQLKLRVLILTYCTSLFINVTGSLLVLHTHGAKGVFLVFLFSMVVVAGVQSYFARHSAEVGRILSTAIRGLVLGLILIASSLTIKALISPLISILWCLAVFPLLALVLKMFSLMEIRAFFRASFKTSS